MDLLNTSSGTVTFESLTNLPSESALTTVGPDVAADDGWSVGKALVVVGYIIALIVLVGGNGLVLYSIASYRFLQNSANMFVAVLAGVDLTFGISVALKAVQVVDPTVFVGLFACQFKLILGISNCFASVLALFAIAVSRYLGTFKPFLYESLVTSRRVAYTAAFIIVYPVTMVTGLSLRYHQWQPNIPCLYFTIYSPGVMLVINMHVFIILPALGIIYLKITIEVARLKRQVAAMIPASLEQGSHQDNGATVTEQVLEEQRRQRSNLQILKNFGIIVGLFAAGWLPYIILCQVIVTDPFYYLQQPALVNVYTVITLVVFTNSMVNPLVYAIRFKRFGLAFRYAFKCVSREELEKQISEQFS